jgi:hypothetical protein
MSLEQVQAELGASSYSAVASRVQPDPKGSHAVGLIIIQALSVDSVISGRSLLAKQLLLIHRRRGHRFWRLKAQLLSRLR